jgi:hypothetical protein
LQEVWHECDVYGLNPYVWIEGFGRFGEVTPYYLFHAQHYIPNYYCAF